MRIWLAVVTAITLSVNVAHAGGPRDRYNHGAETNAGKSSDAQRVSNKDGYMQDAERVTNRDGYVPDTASSLVDSKSIKPATTGSKGRQKKPAAPDGMKQ